LSIRKYTSILLSICMLSQSLLPVYAMERELEKAPLTVLSQKGRTSASIFHFANKDSEILIPLGRRDDSTNIILGDWGNLGGGSEETADSDPQAEILPKAEMTLDEDAARESNEESNGIYAPHAQVLRTCPFIDILTVKNEVPFLHRMYWQQIRYVAPEIFKLKLQEASSQHNKEYSDFMWIRAADLWKAVIEKNPIIQVGSTQINVYKPLFDTLSTPSGMAFLEKLSKSNTLKTTGKKPTRKEEVHTYFSVRKYMNCFYNLGNEDLTNHFYKPAEQHPPIQVIEGFEEDGTSKIISTLQERKVENQVQDANFRNLYPHAEILRPNTYEFVPLKNAKEEYDLAKAVAAHGMAMILLKRRFNHDNPTPIPTPNVPLWNSHCDETISRIHLRIVLGPDYKTPDDFKLDQNPRRSADLANIKEYFHRYSQVEYDQKIKEDVAEKDKTEFMRQLHLLESDYKFFADYLEFEEEMKQWATFSHGASENVNNLLKSITYIRELISLKPFDGLLALRGTDIYFKDAKTVKEMLDRTGDNESEETKAAMLFTNFSVFSGRNTSVSTSSSGEYVINDHSVDEPDIIGRFEEALALAGFSKPVYDYYQSLFIQYVKYKNYPYGNSILVAFSQNPDDIDTYNYSSRGDGRYYTIPSTLQNLCNIQAEYERLEQLSQQTGITEDFTEESERKKSLFPENRTHLYPGRVLDLSKTRIKSIDRFPLSAEEKEEYDQEMRLTTIPMMAKWLDQKSTVMEGSFIEYPALKELHKVIYKGITGQELQETVNADGFIHLIRNGHLKAVKGYLTNYPDVLKHEKTTPQILIRAAMESNDPSVIDYIVKELLQSNLNALLSREDFILKMREAIAHELNLKLFFYLLENYALSEQDKALPLEWLKQKTSFRPDEPVDEYIDSFYKVAPHLIEEALDLVCSKTYSQDMLIKIIKKPFVNLQSLLERQCTEFYKLYQKNPTSPTHSSPPVVRALIENGADIRKLHSHYQEPLIFMMCAASFNWESTFLHNSKGLLDLKNKEGFTLLQFLQKVSFETKSPLSEFFRFIYQLHQKEGRDYLQDSYPPYLDYFGNSTPWYFDYFEGMSLEFTENRLWIESLRTARNGHEVSQIVDQCPNVKLLEIFEGKIIDTAQTVNILNQIKNKKVELKNKQQAWEGKVQALMSPSSDLNDLKTHLDNAPSLALLHKYLGNLVYNDRYSHLLPEVLQKLYPSSEEKKRFVAEKVCGTVAPYTSSTSPLHPLLFTLPSFNKLDGSSKAFNVLLNFVGIENIPSLYLPWNTTCTNLLKWLPEAALERLYEITPQFFTDQSGWVNRFSCFLTIDLPLTFKRKVVFENIDRLTDIQLERQDASFWCPYFWQLFENDANFPVVQELVEKHPSLLDVKTLDGLGIQHFQAQFPKNKVTSFIKKQLRTRCL
jgi:hypothetical protein